MAINMSVVFYVLISVCHLASASASTCNIISQAILCPGDVLTTECTIMGGGVIVWRGTAFQCVGNKILLQHSLFGESYNHTGSCNNGTIVAQALGVVNGSYTSQLNVTASLELNNTTVECVHKHAYVYYYNLTDTVIKQIQIIVLAADSVKVSNIDILNINSREITFNWTQPDNAMCSVSHYELTATNCGRCPNETGRLDTQATCTEISTDGRLCTFSVQAIGTFNESQPVSITAFIKDKPRVNVAHYRAANDPQEDVVRVLINEVALFNISDEVDGSAASYSITYTDSTFSYICGSTVISASTCESGVCSDWFDIASSPCARSTSVMVTAFATNLLGDGPPSQPIEIVLLSENDGIGRPVFDVRFIVFSTVSSAANILLLASIFVIIAIVVRQRKSQGDDANSGNEGTEATAVYDEINLHPPLPPDIDSRENVAYRQTIFQEATCTTVYDEINLHPPSSADINTKENVAYRL